MIFNVIGPTWRQKIIKNKKHQNQLHISIYLKIVAGAKTSLVYQQTENYFY